MAALIHEFRGEVEPLQIAFDPGDAQILIASLRRLTLHVAATGETVSSTVLPADFSGAAFSRERRSLLVAFGNELHELSNDAGLRPLASKSKASALHGSSPDETHALVAYESGEIALLDLASLAEQIPFALGDERSLAPAPCEAGAVSLGGAVAATLQASALHRAISTVTVWRRESDVPRVFEEPVDRRPPSGRNFAISPDGGWLLFAGGGRPFLLNVDTMAAVRPLQLSFGPAVHNVDFSPTGRDLLLAGNRGAAVIDAASGAQRHLLEPPSLGVAALRCARFSHDGRRVAAAASDGRVFLWDVS